MELSLPARYLRSIRLALFGTMLLAVLAFFLALDPVASAAPPPAPRPGAVPTCPDGCLRTGVP